MITLTANEIWRTSFRRLESSGFKSVFGRTHPHVDANHMCPYCKYELTDVVRDEAYLKPFAEMYAKWGCNFKVIHCPACEAVFSYYWHPINERNQ